MEKKKLSAASLSRKVKVHWRPIFALWSFLDSVYSVCRVKPGGETRPLWRQQAALPFRAMTLLAGFMMALSAEMGLRMGVLGSAMSMITTWVCSPTFSRMQMNLSDSMVKVLKPMLAGLIPKFWSWETKKKEGWKPVGRCFCKWHLASCYGTLASDSHLWWENEKEVLTVCIKERVKLTGVCQTPVR